jgi:hypothetical protein
MTFNTPNICLSALEFNQEFSAISGQITGRFLYSNIISAPLLHFRSGMPAFMTGNQQNFSKQTNLIK